MVQETGALKSKINYTHSVKPNNILCFLFLLLHLLLSSSIIFWTPSHLVFLEPTNLWLLSGKSNLLCSNSKLWGSKWILWQTEDWEVSQESSLKQINMINWQKKERKNSSQSHITHIEILQQIHTCWNTDSYAQAERYSLRLTEMIKPNHTHTHAQNM